MNDRPLIKTTNKPLLSDETATSSPATGSIVDGQHLSAEWEISFDHETRVVSIVTVEDPAWFICEMCGGLPGDENGANAARHIIAMHNSVYGYESNTQDHLPLHAAKGGG